MALYSAVTFKEVLTAASRADSLKTDSKEPEMKKQILTVVVTAAFVAALAVLGGCELFLGRDEEDPGEGPVPETISITDEQLYLSSNRAQSASFPGNYTVKLMREDLAWESVGTSIKVGEIDNSSLSLDLQRLETSQLSPLFTGAPVGATVDPRNHNVLFVRKFQIYDAGGVATGTFLYQNNSGADAVFLYSAGPLIVSASIAGGNIDFHAEPGWNWLWSDSYMNITNDPPNPLNAKWVYTAW